MAIAPPNRDLAPTPIRHPDKFTREVVGRPSSRVPRWVPRRGDRSFGSVPDRALTPSGHGRLLGALPPQVRDSWPRQFTLLWGGTVLSQLGSLSASTATPLLAFAITGSPVFVGWLAAAGTIPGLLLHLPAGQLVDRFDQWWIMRASQLARAVAGAVLVAGLVLFPAPAPLLIALAVVEGIGATFYNIAEVAAVRDVVPEDLREAAMAKSEARQHIAVLAGRPLGGLLFGLHRTLPYALGTITALVSISILIALHGRGAGSAPEERPARCHEGGSGGLGTALGLIVGDQFLRATLGACAVANFFFQTVSLLLVVMAHEQNLTIEVFGLLLISSGLGGLLASLIATRLLKLYGPRIVVIGAVWLWLPMIIIVEQSDRAVIGLVAWGACSFMGALINVALFGYQMATAPPGLLGRVAGINRLLTGGAVSLGAMSSGYIVAGLHPHRAAILAAFAFGFIAIVTTALLMDLDWLVAAHVGLLHGLEWMWRQARSEPAALLARLRRLMPPGSPEIAPSAAFSRRE